MKNSASGPATGGTVGRMYHLREYTMGTTSTYRGRSPRYAANSAMGRVLSLVGDLIFLALCIIPKSNRVWVFGSWIGEKYTDNSKYLFEYVNEHHPTIRAIWLTRNRTTRDRIRNRGYEAHLITSGMGLFARLVSGVWVISKEMHDVNASFVWPLGRVKIVQLWHGTPLKKIGYDDPHDPTVNRERPLPRFQALLLNAMATARDMYIAPSPEVQARMAEAFRLPRERVEVTGYPRNDAFFHPTHVPLSAELRVHRAHQITVGIYLPTWRDTARTPHVPLIDELRSIDTALGELRVLLLVKPHFYDVAGAAAQLSALHNVRLITDGDIDQDIYSILPDTDFLITDYSSVYFDYLLLDKPIVFAPFDLEHYMGVDRALYYKYDDVTPGPKARTWHEVLTFIDDVAHGRDAYKEDRHAIDRLFNTFHDGDSSKRVYEAVMNEIHEHNLHR
ncbi:MAG: CDP-glycerol glycerophosphotransferase family protein [Halobacteriota archaeon]